MECSITLNMQALSQSAFLWSSSIPKYSSVIPVINKPESPHMSAAAKPITDKSLWGITKRSVLIHPTSLNAHHIGLVGSCCSPSIVFAELHSSDGAVCDGRNK